MKCLAEQDGQIKSVVHPNYAEDIYIYSSLQKNWALDKYQYIYIYGVHRGKVLILENVSGCKKIINM